jgi:glycosyltransferase involved in cell wall biosynthesis
MFDACVPPYQRLADRCLARATTHAIAVSASVGRFLAQQRYVPQERIEIVYNGVPLGAFGSPPPDPWAPRGACAWRQEQEIPAAHAVVAIVGRLHPIKGHGDFLEAARRVAAEIPDVTFVIVGDGDLLPDLERRAREPGLAGRIRFLGHRSDVPQVLAGVDIKVIASLSEGIPLTLYEALWAGCAVVSTAVGGLPELLRDADNALLVAPGDPVTLATAVLRLLRDRELRGRIAASGQATALRFDIEESVRRQEAIYRRLARR